MLHFVLSTSCYLSLFRCISQTNFLEKHSEKFDNSQFFHTIESGDKDVLEMQLE